MKTVEITLYKFNELSSEAQQTAIQSERESMYETGNVLHFFYDSCVDQLTTLGFKNPVPVNCHVWNGHEFIKEQREGVKIDQILMNGHEFYITKTPYIYDGLMGYSLTEYSTGFCLSGTYPEKTANKAAQWLQLRFDGKGSHFIIKCVQEMLTKYGRINGVEKQYLIDGKTVSYSNLPEIGVDSTEWFDLDTIPCPYTYYLENGLIIKRII